MTTSAEGTGPDRQPQRSRQARQSEQTATEQAIVDLGGSPSAGAAAELTGDVLPPPQAPPAPPAPPPPPP
ncbi:hypothetical protein AAHZ94_31040, partial [Streptomyces sp. HSW2009]